MAPQDEFDPLSLLTRNQRMIIESTPPWMLARFDQALATATARMAARTPEEVEADHRAAEAACREMDSWTPEEWGSLGRLHRQAEREILQQRGLTPE